MEEIILGLVDDSLKQQEYSPDIAGE